MVWETPNPEWWTERGYAVVRADARGTGKSRGPARSARRRRTPRTSTTSIEWCGTQPWSNGKVASSGISWYAMIGWRVAALQPPHLAALVAWEGLTDFYREWARQGGIYTNAFTEFWWRTQIEVQRNTERRRRLGDASCHAASCWTTGIASVRPISPASRCRCSRPATGVRCTCTCAATSRGSSAPPPSTSGSSSTTGTHIDPYYTDWGKELQLRFLDRFLKGRRRRDGRRAAGAARNPTRP